MRDTTYDSKSYDLAEDFLADAGLFGDLLKNHSDLLAKRIQEAIEDYIKFDLEESK